MAEGARRRARFAEALARRRVALGFVAGVAALVLARPTWEAWGVGLLIALAGEGVRIWAAGHLEKGREVTRSGPYRVMPHPLYTGSVVIAIGAAVASRSVAVAVVTGLYMSLTIAAAIRTEEAHLRRTFGAAYDEYRASRGTPMERRFSLARARRNREHRGALGVLAGFGLLALKILLFL